jgi:hypothetical protein
MMDLKTFRQVSKDVPLAKRPQKWWDLLSIIGGVVAAVIWIIYSGMSPTGGGFDLLTVILMIALPVALVWFRGPIDGLLLPIQPTRKKVPKLVLVGAGIVIPFLTAFILYNIFNIANYPLIQWNLIIGTLCSYILVRDPVLATGTQPPGISGRPTMTLIVVMISLLFIPVLADDCASDPTRAEDCLRTPGFAELISGTAAAGLSILVNGPIIIQTVAAGAGSGVSAGSGSGTGTTGSPGTSPVPGTGTGTGAQTPSPTGYFENGQPYWGTGSRNDPFRDYPDANNPPYMPSPDGKGPIWGDGTRDNPYTDTAPPVFDHTPVPPDTSTPPVTPPKKAPVSPPKTQPQTPPATTPAPKTEMTPEPAPEPEKTPEPVTEPEPEKTPEPVTEPKTEKTPEPTTEPKTEKTPEPVTEPKTEPKTEPVTEPKTEPKTEPTTEKTEPEKGEGEGEDAGEDKTVPEQVIEGVDTVKENVDDLNDKIGQVKDFVDNNNLHDFSDETKKKVENLQKNIKDYSDKVNDVLGEIKDNAEAVKDKIDTLKEIKQNLDEIKKNIDDLHKTTKDIPMDPRSRAMLDTIQVTTDAAGRGFDKVLRNTLGDKVADAVNAKDLGKDAGKAMGKTVENVTKTNREIEQMALNGDKDAQEMMGQEDYQKAKDRAETRKAIDDYRKQQADAEQAKKDRLKSYHPPPGSVQTNKWYPWNWKLW